MITAEMVKKLREETGAGVLEAKKTLEATGGDFEKAAAVLRQKGLEKAIKKENREAREGLVEVYAHPGNRVGVMLELNCETDFVGRNEKFRHLAHNLALHIAAMAPRYVKPEDVPAADLDREVSRWRADAQAEGKPEAIMERIVSGRVAKFYQDTCLTEQVYVRDENVRIKELVTEAIRTLGENIVIRRFARYELGEEL
ncbi:MAG: translation elongation factor Ts [Chloroflexota bacterium]